MPSVAQEGPQAEDGRVHDSNGSSNSSIFAKKRRRDEFLGAASYNRHTLPSAQQNGSHDVVAIFVHGSDRDRASHHSPQDYFGLDTTSSSHTLNRKILPLAKRLRLSDDDRKVSSSKPSHERIPSSTLANSITTPCHICHRRPRRKVDLDSLADCEGCGERTCFVCLRECLGWEVDAANELERPRITGHDHRENGHAHRHQQTPSFSMMTDAWEAEEGATPASDGLPTPLERPRSEKDELRSTGETGHPLLPWSSTSRGHRRMVCSRCCVERGEDGDVVCLGCMAFVGE